LYKNGTVAAEGQIFSNDGTVVVDFSVPQVVPNLAGVRQISSGPRPCALLAGGEVRCFEDVATVDHFNDSSGFQRSELLSAISNGASKVSGDQEPHFLKDGIVYRVDLQVDAAQKTHSASVVATPLREVEDFCAKGDTVRYFGSVCAISHTELLCLGKGSPVASDSEGKPLAEARSDVVSRPLPGISVAALDCIYSVTVLGRDGSLWVSRPNQSQRTLRRLENFPKAKDWGLSSNLFCAIDLQGRLHCCGEFTGGAFHVGSGKMADSLCRPEVIEVAESAD
jgi:hypothetical protein